MAHTTTARPTGKDTGPQARQRASIQSVELRFSLLDEPASSGGSLILRDLVAAAGMNAAKARRYLAGFPRLAQR